MFALFRFGGRKRRRKNRKTKSVKYPLKTRDILKYHIRKERLQGNDDDRLLRKKRLLDFKTVHDVQENSMKSLPSHKLSPNQTLEFKSPRKTPTCIRRELRRAYLFSSGFAGRGKVKSAKWTDKSHVRC